MDLTPEQEADLDEAYEELTRPPVSTKRKSIGSGADINTFLGHEVSPAAQRLEAYARRYRHITDTPENREAFIDAVEEVQRAIDRLDRIK